MQAVISSGSLRLDCALGIGGFPRGQITEISGDVSSGKTTLCQQIIAQANRLPGNCVWIDADHTFDPGYSEHCGVILNKLYLAQPASAEQAFDMTERLARSKSFVMIVIDSLTGLIPLEELITPLGEPVHTTLDTTLAKWLPNLVSAIQFGDTALVVTNQTQTGLSRVYHKLESHLDRMALPLSAGLRLRLENVERTINSQENRQIRVQVVKNKFAPCFKSIDLDIIVNRGINNINEILDLGVELGALSRQGAMIYYQGQRLGSTRQETIEAIQRNPHLAKELEEVIRRDMRC